MLASVLVTYDELVSRLKEIAKAMTSEPLP